MRNGCVSRSAVGYHHLFKQLIDAKLKSETQNKNLALEKNAPAAGFFSASIRELSSVFFHQLICIQIQEVLNFKAITA